MSNQHGPEGHHPGRARRTVQAVQPYVRPGSFPLLLIAGLLLYVLTGLVFDSTAGAILVLLGRRCALRGHLRAERESDHALARGSRRRGLDDVRSPIVDAG